MRLNLGVCSVSVGSTQRSDPYSPFSAAVVSPKVFWVGAPCRWRILKIVVGGLLPDLFIIIRNLHLVDNLPPFNAHSNSVSFNWRFESRR